MQWFRTQNALWILVMALGLAVPGGCGKYEVRGNSIEEPKPAPDFTLTDHNGQPFRMADQRGKVVLLFFGYTSCPDVCPTTLADMAALKRELGKAAKDVEIVFVTVDPERDTQERLKGYVTGFDPTFIGLRGSQQELERVFKDYGVTAIRRELPNSALGYAMDHSAFTYVIDRQGMWREIFGYGMPVEDMASDVRYLVQQ